MVRQKIVPRGIRNNNPLNIRIGNTWLGEKDNPDDNVFEQFVTIEYGLRAAFLILRRYIRRYKLNTIRLIVSRWAPEVENKTEAYISAVCKTTGLDADIPVLFEDKETLCRIVSAMCLVECGCTVDIAKIEKGYDMA